MTLAVDEVSLDLVRGSIVDYVESLGGSAFKVENPNAAARLRLRLQLRRLIATLPMKIASFNINGVKARLPRLLEWLEETQPDVACLQEIKSSDDTFPAHEFEGTGYTPIWHGQKGFNGVAILSRGDKPATEVLRGLPGDDEDTHSRYLEADYKGVRVVCIYLPNGNPVPGPKFDYKLAWMERLRTRMAQSARGRDPQHRDRRL